MSRQEQAEGPVIGIGFAAFLAPGGELSAKKDDWATDSKISAFDAMTEDEVWDSKLTFGGYAPTTTCPLENRQYVIIPSTGGGKPAKSGPFGVTYVAFALPDRAAAPVESALFFREDFKEVPPEVPVAQEHLSNPDLILHRFGQGEGQIKKSFHTNIQNDPHYAWSGLCEGNWAVALEHESARVDLSVESAKIVLRTKQAADRILYPIVETEQNWLIADRGTPATEDWEMDEIEVRQCKWNLFYPDTIERGKRIDEPDLTSISQVGFTDLRPGGGSRACSRLDWIEVYGRFSPGG